MTLTSLATLELQMAASLGADPSAVDTYRAGLRSNSTVVTDVITDLWSGRWRECWVSALAQNG